MNPFIAYILPFGTTINFFIQTLMTLLVSSILVYHLLRILQYEKKYALTGLIFFLGMGWIIKYNVYDFWLTDSLLNVFVLLVLVSLVRKKEIAFALLLAAGILVKETILFVAPLYYTFNSERIIHLKLLSKNILLVLPSLSLLLIVRLLIPGLNGDLTYIASLPPGLQNVTYNSSNYDFVKLVLSFHIQYSFFEIIAIVISAYGFIPVLFSVLGIKKNKKIVLMYFPLIIFSLLQLFYAINIPRLLTIGFWPVLLMGVNGIKYISTKYNISVYWFILTAVTIPIMNLSSNKTFMIPDRIQVYIFICSVMVFTFKKLYKRVLSENSIPR
ncbi:MAG: hypothetical protein NTX65_00160 [Ignavibacteriales bacterium]|nr:hypothetical protein [Ignavibacteriales bacterium]